MLVVYSLANVPQCWPSISRTASPNDAAIAVSVNAHARTREHTCAHLHTHVWYHARMCHIGTASKRAGMQTRPLATIFGTSFRTIYYLSCIVSSLSPRARLARLAFAPANVCQSTYTECVFVCVCVCVQVACWCRLGMWHVYPRVAGADVPLSWMARKSQR